MKSSRYLLILMLIGFVCSVVTGKYNIDVIILAAAYFIVIAIEDKKS